MAKFAAVRFIKAVKIFDGVSFLPPETVLVYDSAGKLSEIASAREISSDKIENYDGILTPGFVNTHCHLELSHLRALLAQKTGFCGFAKELMAKRGAFSEEEVQEAMRVADQEMAATGIVAVGDISNSPVSFGHKAKSTLYYHTFVELLALNPDMAETVFSLGVELLHSLQSKGLNGSLTPHAPYSVSNELLKKISLYNSEHDLPLSIHNQESIEEHRFFMGERCQVHELYEHLNIGIDFFVAPGVSSLKSYISQLSGQKNILVHNTYSGVEDVAVAAKKNVYWCFCPGANLYIEGCLPDFSLFRDLAAQICIGTDSLASNGQLNVLAELNLIRENAPFFTEEELLAMICSNGARALGMEEHFGSLQRGRKAGLNLLRRTGTGFQYIKKIF